MATVTDDFFTTKGLEDIAGEEGLRLKDLQVYPVAPFFHFTAKSRPEDMEASIKRHLLTHVPEEAVRVIDFHYSISHYDGMTAYYWAEGKAVVPRKP